jgi:GT2 family glycosyltransferase
MPVRRNTAQNVDGEPVHPSALRRNIKGDVMSSLVSVIVPVYNGARYLRECLDSIVAQTYPNLEVLVMDDHSTDESGQIAQSYGSKVRCYRQPHNVGQFANVSDGIQRATGDYIAVFHADDVYQSTIIEREVDFLSSQPAVGAVFCLDRMMDSTGREYGKVELPPGLPGSAPLEFPVVFNALLEFQNRFLRTPGAMVRASVYQELGLYCEEKFGMAADLEMWLRISKNYPIAILPEHLFSYRHFHGSVSQDYDHLRTRPHIGFEIMDLYLDQGARAVATNKALAAYEAHRAQDRLMCAINAYIKGDLAEMRILLVRVDASRLLRSRRIQRGRMLVLLACAQLLCRLPRIGAVANIFHRRWHRKRTPNVMAESVREARPKAPKITGVS